MTYAARITALPLPDAICRDDTQHGMDYYTTAGLRDYQAQAEVIAAEADTELSALREMVGELERADEYEFCVYEGEERENGTLMCVASGTSSDLEEVKKEAAHYAAMYSQDGPVTVESTTDPGADKAVQALPPLPEPRTPAAYGAGWFTAGQMQAYARAALTASPPARPKSGLYQGKCPDGDVCIHGCHVNEACHGLRNQLMIAADPQCPHCRGTGVDGDVGPRGETIDIDCTCRFRHRAPNLPPAQPPERPAQQEAQEAVAHICVLPTKDAGPTKFFTSPSDPRGFPVYASPPRPVEPMQALSEVAICELADAKFPDWRIDIQQRFVVELIRAYEAARGIGKQG